MHTALLLPTETSRNRKSPRGRLKALGLGVWLLAPVAAVAVLSIVASQQSLTRPVETVWVEAREAADSISFPVDLALTWAAPNPLRAPNWGGGLTQAVLVKSGDQIVDAQELARIGGVTIVAVRSEEPFYRPISRGSRGPDVRALNEFLTRNKFATVEGEVATGATVTGIRSFGEKIGMRNMSIFDPGWVVHLRADAYQVATVKIDQGTPAPALGEPIITGTSTLRSATVVASGSFAINSGPTDEPLDLDEIDRRSVTVQPDREVWLGSEQVALTLDRSDVDPASFSTIFDSVPVNTLSVQANQVRASVEGDVVVPSATVFASAAGQTCVYLESASRATVIEVLADEGGSAIIRGAVKAGDRLEVSVTGARRQCN